MTTALRALPVLAACALFGPTPATAQLILAPDPGESVAAELVLVAVAFAEPARLDPTTLALRIGAAEVTDRAELADGVLTWRPETPLAAGPHRIVVSVRDTAGLALPALEWTFTVTAPERIAVVRGTRVPGPARARSAMRPRGSVVLEGSGGSVTGPGAELRRDEPFVPRLWVTASGELRPGWRYAALAHVSGYESSGVQPVNRFRGDLRIPWASVSVGDVDPTVHDVILSGRTVRGGHAALGSGRARLDVVAGRSMRAIPGLLHPLDRSLVSRFGTHAQDLLAVRPSVGFGTSVRFGATLLRVRDDVGSIPQLSTIPAALDGGVRSANPAPRDNLVAGVDAALTLAGGRVDLRYGGAISLLTRDISDGPSTRADLDSFFVAAGFRAPGIDPGRYRRWFVVNETLMPLDPSQLTSTAHQLRGSLRVGGHDVGVEWRTIGADYHTLGRPGMQRNRRGLRVRDAFPLVRDAVFVSLGYEQDRDNLDGSAPGTVRTRGGWAAATWQAPRNGIYLSGSARLSERGNGLSRAEDGPLDESTRSLTTGASVPLHAFAAVRTRVHLNAAFIEREDRFRRAAGTRDLYLLGGVQVESLDRGSEVSVMLGGNRAEVPTPASDGIATQRRVLASGRHRLTEAWLARFDGSLTAATSGAGSAPAGSRYRRGEAVAGGEWTWRRDTILSFGAGVVSFADHVGGATDTRELVAQLRMSRSF
jgi:hypothetical protein